MSQHAEASTSRLFAPPNAGIFSSLPQRTVSQLLVSTGAMAAPVLPQHESLSKNATVQVLQQQPVSTPPSPGRRQASPQRPPMAPDELADIGIKVRDFAYESKLPPLPPYRPPQVQPLPRSPQRLARNEPNRVLGTAKLGRVVTEPVLDDPSKRHAAYDNMEVDVLMTAAEITSDDDWYIPQSQPALTESQESEDYVNTPLVTPNGSLQWINDTSDVPESQLDTESQQPAPEMLSFAQLGFLSQPDDDQMDVDDAPAFRRRDESRLSLLSPLTSLSRMSTPSLSSPSPPPEMALSPRYNLRKRPSPPPPQISEPPATRSRPTTRKPASTSRTSHHKAAASPKPRPVRKSVRSASRK